MSSVAANGSAAAVPVDFRRPSRISRDALVAIESMHDAFARRVATAWSASSYSVVDVEHVATDQLSIDDFVQSLPLPTTLATVRVDRIATNAFLQIDLPFALLYVERLLGGAADASVAAVSRRPTDLESVLVTQELYGPAVAALDDALRDLDGEPCQFLDLETTPQPLQLGAPDELLLLLTYRLEVRGDQPAQGLATIAYPAASIVARVDELLDSDVHDGDGSSEQAAMDVATSLSLADVEVQVRLGGNPVPAGLIVGLAPGDVLRFDHPLDRPADLVVDDRVVGTAHPGRRRRRMAAQVLDPPSYTRYRSAPRPSPQQEQQPTERVAT